MNFGMINQLGHLTADSVQQQMVSVLAQLAEPAVKRSPGLAGREPGRSARKCSCREVVQLLNDLSIG